MIEADWCISQDPTAMLEWLLNGHRNLYRYTPDGIPIGVSPRTLRLFACACCRRLEHIMLPRTLTALNALEDQANGDRTDINALAHANDVSNTFHSTWLSKRQLAQHEQAAWSINDAVAILADEVGPIGMPQENRLMGFWTALSRAEAFSEDPPRNGPSPVPPHWPADILREVVGNPFRTIIKYGEEPNIFKAMDMLGREAKQLNTYLCVHPNWLTRNDALVPKLAAIIYKERRWDDMPMLADALEEFGCEDVEILNHCRYRSNISHVRGCWVLDLLLDQT